MLRVWRAGATWTPARRYRTPERQRCPHCGYAHASARHWWAECPRFDADRARLAAALPPGMADWWLTQPRCTAKTGWVTRSCHAIPEERARLQVKACELGIIILETPLPDTPAAPNGVVHRRLPG